MNSLLGEFSSLAESDTSFDDNSSSSQSLPEESIDDKLSIDKRREKIRDLLENDSENSENLENQNNTSEKSNLGEEKPIKEKTKGTSKVSERKAKIDSVLGEESNVDSSQETSFENLDAQKDFTKENKGNDIEDRKSRIESILGSGARRNENLSSKEEDHNQEGKTFRFEKFSPGKENKDSEDKGHSVDKDNVENIDDSNLDHHQRRVKKILSLDDEIHNLDHESDKKDDEKDNK